MIPDSFYSKGSLLIPPPIGITKMIHQMTQVLTITATPIIRRIRRLLQAVGDSNNRSKLKVATLFLKELMLLLMEGVVSRMAGNIPIEARLVDQEYCSRNFCLTCCEENYCLISIFVMFIFLRSRFTSRLKITSIISLEQEIHTKLVGKMCLHFVFSLRKELLEDAIILNVKEQS